jgi:hypothetical protein
MCERESKWVCRTLLVKYSGHATGSACVCVLPCFVLQVSSIAVLHNLWNSSEEENQKFQSSPSVLSQFVTGLHLFRTVYLATWCTTSQYQF